MSLVRAEKLAHDGENRKGKSSMSSSRKLSFCTNNNIASSAGAEQKTKLSLFILVKLDVHCYFFSSKYVGKPIVSSHHFTCSSLICSMMFLPTGVI